LRQRDPAMPIDEGREPIQVVGFHAAA
jgi:hypothetical protein